MTPPPVPSPQLIFSHGSCCSWQFWSANCVHSNISFWTWQLECFGQLTVPSNWPFLAANCVHNNDTFWSWQFGSVNCVHSHSRWQFVWVDCVHSHASWQFVWVGCVHSHSRWQFWVSWLCSQSLTLTVLGQLIVFTVIHADNCGSFDCVHSHSRWQFGSVDCVHSHSRWQFWVSWLCSQSHKLTVWVSWLCSQWQFVSWLCSRSRLFFKLTVWPQQAVFTGVHSNIPCSCC